MLRPFPQYNGISDEWGDVGNSHYNSLQIAANKRVSHGLTFNFNYTWAKAFDDTAGARTAYNLKIEKAPTAIPPHTVNFLWVYDLPFGHGKRADFYHRAINVITGNWQLSGITTYRDGAPISTIIGACNLPQAGTCYASYAPGYTGDPRINGSYGSGNLLGSNTTAFLDRNAFVSTAPYTYGNTPRTGAFGLSNPSFWNQDLSLKRRFPIHENIALMFQVDAFNAFNAVMFSPFGTPGTPSPALNITSASFGKITSQANSPRALQLSARVVF